MSRTMDVPSRAAATLLGAIALCNERLIDLSRRLAMRPGIRSSSQSLSIRQYGSGPMLEAYVDAELTTGKAAVWGLELTWDQAGWTIDYFVRANDDQGQYSVQEFETLTASTFNGVQEHLKKATDDLCAAAVSADVASF